MADRRLTRQADIISYKDKDSRVTVVGLGGIGSPLIYTLVKMGIPGEDIVGYDYDEVDEVNLNSQFYSYRDVGDKKAHALQKNISTFEGVDIMTMNEKYTGQGAENILVLAVDSIEERRKIFRASRNSPDINFIIDARMGSEFSEIFTIDNRKTSDIKNYATTLHPQSEVLQEPCTRKAIVYTAWSTASTIANIVKKILMEEEVPTWLQIDHKGMEMYKVKF